MGKLHSFLLALSVFLLDRGTKFFVRYSYRNEIFAFSQRNLISLRYVRNPGGAFGLFSRKSFSLSVFTLLAVGFLVYLLFFSGLQRDLTKVGLALLLGGSLGNLADRIIMGSVLDFIQLGNLFVFNFADVAIVVGSGILIFVLSGGTRLIGN